MDNKLETLLENTITGLRSLADAIEFLKESGHFAKTENQNKQPELFSETVNNQEPEDEESLTLVDVRKVLAEKSRDGYTEQVRELLIKYGADKLSEINPKNYSSLVKEAETLGATIEDIKSTLKQLQDKNLESQIQAVLEHHFAKTLEDLKPDYYSSFLRDIKELI